MKLKVIFIMLIVLEILALILVPLTFNIKKYDSWPEEQVSAGTEFQAPSYHNTRNNQGKMMTVMMYSCNNDGSWLFEFSDYTPEIKEGDKLIINIDPEDRSEAVYIPYEKYKVKKRRIAAIIICVALTFITVIWYRIEKETEKELHPFSIANKTGK